MTAIKIGKEKDCDAWVEVRLEGDNLYVTRERGPSPHPLDGYFKQLAAKITDEDVAALAKLFSTETLRRSTVLSMLTERNVETRWPAGDEPVDTVVVLGLEPELAAALTKRAGDTGASIGDVVHGLVFDELSWDLPHEYDQQTTYPGQEVCRCSRPLADPVHEATSVAGQQDDRGEVTDEG